MCANVCVILRWNKINFVWCVCARTMLCCAVVYLRAYVILNSNKQKIYCNLVNWASVYLVGFFFAISHVRTYVSPFIRPSVRSHICLPACTTCSPVWVICCKIMNSCQLFRPILFVRVHCTMYIQTRTHTTYNLW